MKYVSGEKELKTITAYQVAGVRNILKTGDIVKAETWRMQSTGDKDGTWTVEDVKILKKYKHIALTDKGAVTWKNITIHNQHLIRGAAVVWRI